MPGYPMLESTQRTAFCLLTFYVGIQPGFADILDFSSDDTLAITADRAWEGDQAGVTHFSGQLYCAHRIGLCLRTPLWCTGNWTIRTG